MALHHVGIDYRSDNNYRPSGAGTSGKCRLNRAWISSSNVIRHYFVVMNVSVSGLAREIG